MTEEELEHKAEENFEKLFNEITPDFVSCYQDTGILEAGKTYYEQKYLLEWWKEGYKQGQKEEIHNLENLVFRSLLKENESLKAQIEKMKCCSNCTNGLRNGLLCDRQIECRKNNNKLWKLAE